MPPMEAMFDDAAEGFVRRVEHVRDGGADGVQGGKEVGLHGAVVGFGGLVFEGADFDDAGVVDEEVEAAEGADGVFDEAGALGGVGEVAVDEEDVVLVEHVAGAKEAVAREFEVVGVAGGEHEFHAGSSELLREGEAEAAGASGDDGYLAGEEALASGQEGVGCGGGEGGRDDGEGVWGCRALHGGFDAWVLIGELAQMRGARARLASG